MKELTQEDLKFIQTWIVTPAGERELQTQAALSRHLGFSEKTISLAIRKMEDVANAEYYDSNKWLVGRTPKADQALLRAVQKGNAQAIRTFYQLLNRLTDKSEVEVKIGLSAEEHRRIKREGDRRLQGELGERASRTGSLLGRIQGVHILSEEVCLDNQSEHSQES